MKTPALTSALALDTAASIRCDAKALQSRLTAPDTRFLVLADAKPVISSNTERTETHIRWFQAAELILAGLDPSAALFLGLDRASGAACFALAVSEAAAGAIGEALQPAVDLRSLATQGSMDAAELSIAGLAKSLADWHVATGFCQRCGQASSIVDGGWRRQCASCSYTAFPRVDPVVIMAVTDGENLVLARQSHFPPGMYSLPAGFIEHGEDIEHAVRRETLEEVGLTAGAIRYELSQPWPFPHSLMIGCIAECSGGDVRPDTAELETARWFARAEVQDMLAGRHRDGLWLPGAHAIAHVLIRRWLGHNGT